MASALRTALVGRAVLRFDAQHIDGPAPHRGRVVEHVESRRRELDVIWDDGFVLHSRMRLGGAWHVYREGEPWRRSSSHLRVAITVPGWVAVCFAPADVETFREFDPQRHPAFGRCAPDVAEPAGEDDVQRSVARLLDHPDRQAYVGDALLDPHVAVGIGNVFRCEALYACGVHPWAAVGELSAADGARLMTTASAMVRANVEAATGVTPNDTRESLLVYGRNGQRCGRCGDTVRVDRVGDRQLVYWCAGCQTAHDPWLAHRRSEAAETTDPHPADIRHDVDPPWRRAAG